MKEGPLLSICVTSYNRVNELYRCLKSIDTINSNDIEIVVSEDCSPKKDGIKKIVDKFKQEVEFNVIFNSNIENLGYDQNLGKLITLSTGDYLLFISDDDMFLNGGIDKLIFFLKSNNIAVAFTPYFHRKTKKMHRKYTKSFHIKRGMNGVKAHVFDSILFSGLIFRRENLSTYNSKKFKNLIYSQVYLVCTQLYENGGEYIDIAVIDCVEDGVNAFGVNASGEKNEIMANRNSPLSNLEYHKPLIKVIKIFDSENSENLINSFSKQYSLRSYTGMSIARNNSIYMLKKYRQGMRSLDIRIHPVSEVYFYMLMFLGVTISNFITSIPRYLLRLTRKSGS